MSIFDRLNKTKLAQIELEKARSQERRARHNAEAVKAKAMLKMFGQTNAAPSASLLSTEIYTTGDKSQNANIRTTAPFSASNDRIRRLSRIAIFESPAASSMIERLCEVVVGAGLTYRPQPYWDLVDPNEKISTEDRRIWEKNVQQRFTLWGKSYAPEYNTRRNLPQLTRDVFRHFLQDGEYFVLLRYSRATKENPMSIQIIPPENITGGSTQIQTNEIVNGIEYDPAGTEVAYHVYDDSTGLTTRVPRFGAKSGKIMMIHTFISDNEKNRRGTPYLANCLQEFVKLGRYEDLEIQAAIVNALFAVWMAPPEDADGEPTISNGVQIKSLAGQALDTNPITDATTYINGLDTAAMNQGGIFVDALPAGHELKSFQTNRPNVNFGAFEKAVKRGLAASRNVPLSVVDLEFAESYSAARGELLLFWMSVDRFRNNHGYDFMDDIFQMWFLGEVARGTIVAPGISDKTVFLAYTNAKWVGNQRPDIDPVKSVTANVIEQDRAYKTGEEITAERGGGDYAENLIRTQNELRQVAINQAPLKGIDALSDQGLIADLIGETIKESVVNNGN